MIIFILDRQTHQTVCSLSKPVESLSSNRKQSKEKSVIFSLYKNPVKCNAVRKLREIDILVQNSTVWCYPGIKH